LNPYLVPDFPVRVIVAILAILASCCRRNESALNV
jgi:hypothetical protein